MLPAVPFPSSDRAARHSAPVPTGCERLRARTVEVPAAKADAMPAAAVAFEVVSDRAGFEALEHEWNDLFERSGCSKQGFQSFNWLWHWSNHYLESGCRAPTLAIVTARRAGVLVLVWPLVRARRAGLTCLTWMGLPVSQYGDVLADDGPGIAGVIEASWQFIVANLKPDLVSLRKVRADAVISPFMTAVLGAHVVERQTAPFLDLASAADFPSYESRYSSKARKNRRRLMRRLEERGAVAFETHHGGAAARDLASLAVLLKRAWLKDRGLVSPALSDARMAAFLADTALGEIRPAGCQVSVLRSAGEAAGIAIAFESKGRLLVHVIVYGLKFDRAGAGNLLVEECLRAAKAAGIETFDLLAPGDAYKMDWADGAVEVTDLAVALTPRGRVYGAVYLGLVRRQMKAAVARLPASLRRFVAASYGALVALI